MKKPAGWLGGFLKYEVGMVGCLDPNSFWKSDIDMMYTVINHSNIIQTSYSSKDVKRVIFPKLR